MKEIRGIDGRIKTAEQKIAGYEREKRALDDTISRIDANLAKCESGSGAEVDLLTIIRKDAEREFESAVTNIDVLNVEISENRARLAETQISDMDATGGQANHEVDDGVYASEEFGEVHIRTGENGAIWINAKDAAFGLGFTRTEVKNGKTYVNVRWARVNGYLEKFGYSKVGKGDYISEEIFNQLATKASTEAGKAFHNWIATLIPSIRKTDVALDEEPAEFEFDDETEFEPVDEQTDDKVVEVYHVRCDIETDSKSDAEEIHDYFELIKDCEGRGGYVSYKEKGLFLNHKYRVIYEGVMHGVVFDSIKLLIDSHNSIHKPAERFYPRYEAKPAEADNDAVAVRNSLKTIGLRYVESDAKRRGYIGENSRYNASFRSLQAGKGFLSGFDDAIGWIARKVQETKEAEMRENYKLSLIVKLTEARIRELGILDPGGLDHVLV